MKIDTLVLGDYQTNCYVVRQNPAAADCIVIDTGLETNQPAEFLKDNNLNPAAVILTHGHVDHILGLKALKQTFPIIKIYIHKLDADMLTNPKSNLLALTGLSSADTQPADILVEEPQVISEANINLQVIHTPGHTPGGICLYSKDDGLLFSGDTLFAQSVGRTDFPGGNTDQLISSIKQKLLILPDDTQVYPGHGPQTTITAEKATNPFLI